MQINQPLSPFEAQVLQLLTEVKVKLDDLAGTNGKYGRVDVLESKATRFAVALVALTVLTLAASSPHIAWLVSWIIK